MVERINTAQAGSVVRHPPEKKHDVISDDPSPEHEVQGQSSIHSGGT